MNPMQKLIASAWYWKLAIFECALDAYVAGAMTWMAAIADKEWADITPTSRHVIWVAVSINMLKVVKAFVSTTIQVLKDARLGPNGNGHAVETVTARQTTEIKINSQQPTENTTGQTTPTAVEPKS